MTFIEEAFLKVLAAGISADDKKGIDGICSLSLTSSDWEALLVLASEQSLLPLILDTCFQAGITAGMNSEQRKRWKEKAVASGIRQIIEEKEFLNILHRAQQQGLDPVVLKGIICRILYPRPMLRPSVDEDILIRKEETEMYHQFLTAEGIQEDEQLTRDEREEKEELSYHERGSSTYIEVHKTLFSSDSSILGTLNDLFPELLRHTMRIAVEDVSILTLDQTYHLLYLILHTFKHFVHSGIGIRSVCDIGLFAEQYRDEIRWDWIRNSLEQVHAFDYCRALMSILQKYLLSEADFFLNIESWRIQEVDAEPLLEDMLSGGLHGNVSLTRLHSSNMTLQAVQDNTGKGESPEKEHMSIWHDRLNSIRLIKNSLFPSAKKMEGRYPYLKKNLLLLPAAWIQRIIHYLKENKREKKRMDSHREHGALESVRIGETRIQLLKQYHVIK